MKKIISYILTGIVAAFLLQSCDDRPFFGADYVPGEDDNPEIEDKIEANVYVAGRDGHIYFRIPALVETQTGLLLAFCEARNTEADFYKGNESLFPTVPVGSSSSKDHGDIDLVVKSSRDGGRTWLPMSVVADDKFNTCGNPSPVVDEDGTIHLFWCWQAYPAQISSDLFPTLPEDGHTRRVMYCKSTDDGQTWSAPVDMTAVLKDPSWTWYATGPCHAIRVSSGKYAGRLIVPCNHRDPTNKINYSHCVYSDDHGATWKLGGSTAAGGNESCIVELPGDKIMTNVRSVGMSSQNRASAISDDGGDSWSPLVVNEYLKDPGCQGSIINMMNGGAPTDTLVLSNCHAAGRYQMTISVSRDAGQSWTSDFVVWPMRAAYSDLCRLKDGSLAILYECGDGQFGTPNPNEKIRFMRIPAESVGKALGLTK